LYDTIPDGWNGGSMFVGRPRDDHSQSFTSDDIERDIQLSLAMVVYRVFRSFGNVLAYRSGPSDLVLLFDRRFGDMEVKVRFWISLDSLGGSYQWKFEIFSCYFFFPGFFRRGSTIVPYEGDLAAVRWQLFGSRWTAPFRLGAFSLLNPLNLFRVFEVIAKGLNFMAEKKRQTYSYPYITNNYLGNGDFIDLALINKVRFAALRQGSEYPGAAISCPTDRMEKETEQLTLTIQQEVQKALRLALEPSIDFAA